MKKINKKQEKVQSEIKKLEVMIKYRFNKTKLL